MDNILSFEKQIFDKLGFNDTFNFISIKDDLTITIEINVKNLSLEKDYLTMCGIDPNKKITVILKFPYNIVIRQDYQSYFGLWWTLENKFRSWIIRNPIKIPPIKKYVSPLTLKDLLNIDLLLAHYVSLKYFNIELDQLLDNFYSNEEEIRKEFSKIIDQIIIDNKNMTTKSSSVALNMINYVKKSIVKAKNKCICCNDSLLLTVFKPTCCMKDLCNFQFINFGLGSNIEMDIFSNPQSVDLLISMTYSTVINKGRLIPNPFFINETFTGRLSQPNAGEFKTIEDVKKVIQLLPSISDMQKLITEGILKESLQTLHPLLYDLLRWILTSNHAHIMISDSTMCPYGQNITFEIKTAPYKKELTFSKLKKIHGSIFVFHGSPFTNWHSILRIGLKNYSNTKYQSNGAAYGEGIYFSDQITTSKTYAHKFSGWPKSSIINSLELSCVAMCEIINVPNCEGLHKPGCSHNTMSPYFRVVNEDMVITRYLMIYY